MNSLILEQNKPRFVKIILFAVLFYCLTAVFGNDVRADILLDWNEEGAGGTNWPGWTWYPGGEGNGADDYGSPGWRNNEGRWYSGGSNWMPRIHNKGSDDEHGSANLAVIDDAVRAPSTTHGGSLRVYDPASDAVNRASWWYIFGDTFGMKGLADETTDRFSLYFKPTGMDIDPQLESQEPHNYNIHLGTYLTWEPYLPKEAGNQHYYHHLTVHDGTWLHVEFDQHPQHLRGVGPVPLNNPAGPEHPYFASMNSFYLEICYSSSQATTYWVDEMKFHKTTQPENDISISSVWVGYWPTTDKWEIGWNDGSFVDSYNDYSHSTFEVRYSTAPITNENFETATMIEPEFHEVNETNLVRRANAWKTVAWTRFELPDATEQQYHTIYFAIKDVSVQGEHVSDSWPYTYGDGHDAPSPYIHTIDYCLRSTHLQAGDLNSDGTVDSQDVNACVNHILGTQDWGEAADVNEDGSVNSLDVQEIVNIILSQ